MAKGLDVGKVNRLVIFILYHTTSLNYHHSLRLFPPPPILPKPFHTRTRTHTHSLTQLSPIVYVHVLIRLRRPNFRGQVIFHPPHHPSEIYPTVTYYNRVCGGFLSQTSVPMSGTLK